MQVYIRRAILMRICSFLVVISGVLFGAMSQKTVEIENRQMVDNLGTDITAGSAKLQWEHPLLPGDISFDYSLISTGDAVNGLRSAPKQQSFGGNAGLRLPISPNSSIGMRLSAGGNRAWDNSWGWFTKAEAAVSVSSPGRFLDLITLSSFIRTGPFGGKPVTQGLHLPSRSWAGSLDLSHGLVQAGLSFQQDYIETIAPTSYRKAIDDTLFFSTYYGIIEPFIDAVPVDIDLIPANRIDRLDAFVCGPLLPYLYVGGFLSYSTSQHNLFVPLSEEVTSQDTLLRYDYLPYKTPMERRYCGISVAAVVQWQWFVRMAKFEAEIPLDLPGLPFPFGSQAVYRGYFIPPGHNLLGGFRPFTYTYSALAPLVLKTSLTTAPLAGVSAKLHYQWRSEPYLRNHYFSSTYSYQYHTVSLQLTGTF